MKRAMHDIFISYSRQTSNTRAQLLYKELSQRNYLVFLDHKDLPSGNYRDYIQTAIEMCKDFIVFLSPGTLDSVWVQEEVKRALLAERNIIPVISEDFIWPDHLPDWMSDLRNQNGVIYHHNDDFDLIVEKVESLLTSKATAARKTRKSAFTAALAGGKYETIITAIVPTAFSIACLFSSVMSAPTSLRLWEIILLFFFAASFFYLIAVFGTYIARAVINNYRNRPYFRLRDIILFPLSIVFSYWICGIALILTSLPAAFVASLIIHEEAPNAVIIMAGIWTIELFIPAAALLRFKIRYHNNNR